MEDHGLLDFIAEAGQLKRTERSGWSVLGIPFKESVADHSFRCAVLGYILAKMEGAEPLKVILMTLFNDIHEARITDLHKMAQKYIEVSEAEDKVYTEQTDALETGIKVELREARAEFREQGSPESILARDADILECLIQAKEYYDLGHATAEKFFKKAPEHLVSKSARDLWEKAKGWDSSSWWEKLSKFER